MCGDTGCNTASAHDVNAGQRSPKDGRGGHGAHGASNATSHKAPNRMCRAECERREDDLQEYRLSRMHRPVHDKFAKKRLLKEPADECHRDGDEPQPEMSSPERGMK